LKELEKKQREVVAAAFIKYPNYSRPSTADCYTYLIALIVIIN